MDAHQLSRGSQAALGIVVGLLTLHIIFLAMGIPLVAVVEPNELPRLLSAHGLAASIVAGPLAIACALVPAALSYDALRDDNFGK